MLVSVVVVDGAAAELDDCKAITRQEVVQGVDVDSNAPVDGEVAPAVFARSHGLGGETVVAID